MSQACATCRHWHAGPVYRCGLSPHARTLPMWGWHGTECLSWQQRDEVAS